MEWEKLVIVAGLGEIGRSLLRILSSHFDCVGVDIQPVELARPCSVLHVCYPFQMPDFIATTMEYIEEYKPSLTIIHSTIAPGTTRRIQQAAGNYPVAYSPVLGKHARMEEDMRRYTKFAAATDPETLQMALDHLAAASFRTAAFRTPEVGELSKLLETTYLGVLIGWAQEVERFAGQIGSSHQEVNAFIEEIEFLPSHIFPGFIGGRCVVPNIKILQTQFQSAFLDAVIESNELKKRQQKVLVAAMG